MTAWGPEPCEHPRALIAPVSPPPPPPTFVVEFHQVCTQIVVMNKVSKETPCGLLELSFCKAFLGTHPAAFICLGLPEIWSLTPQPTETAMLCWASSSPSEARVVSGHRPLLLFCICRRNIFLQASHLWETKPESPWYSIAAGSGELRAGLIGPFISSSGVDVADPISRLAAEAQLG